MFLLLLERGNGDENCEMRKPMQAAGVAALSDPGWQLTGRGKKLYGAPGHSGEIQRGRELGEI